MEKFRDEARTHIGEIKATGSGVKVVEDTQEETRNEGEC